VGELVKRGDDRFSQAVLEMSAHTYNQQRGTAPAGQGLDAVSSALTMAQLSC
jgi:hypothetical protein